MAWMRALHAIICNLSQEPGAKGSASFVVGNKQAPPEQSYAVVALTYFTAPVSRFPNSLRAEVVGLVTELTEKGCTRRCSTPMANDFFQPICIQMN